MNTIKKLHSTFYVLDYLKIDDKVVSKLFTISFVGQTSPHIHLRLSLLQISSLNMSKFTRSVFPEVFFLTYIPNFYRNNPPVQY